MSDKVLGFFMWAYFVLAIAWMIAGNTAAGFGALIMSTLFQFELRRQRGGGV